MLLNTIIVNELEKNGDINLSFFSRVISTKDLPMLIRKNTSVGFKWGEWTRTARLIEDLAFKYGYFDDFSLSSSDLDQVFNFFYFFPSQAIKSEEAFAEVLLKLPRSKLILMLESREICQYITNYISKSAIEEYLIIPYIYILWANNSHSLINVSEEMDLLDRIISDIKRDSIFRDFIQKRYVALKEESNNSNADKPLRCALLISGQFRFTNDIQSLLTPILSNNIINVSEVFIASWSKIGGIDTQNKDKVYRYLHPDLISKIQAGEYSLQEIVDGINTKHRKIDFRQFSESTNIPIRVKLNNEDEYPYNCMMNPEKMYFNNAYWIRTLGEDYFSNRFDYIIKVRPDLQIDQFTIDSSSVSCSSILSEEGWIFRNWGFGMGDQILSGKTTHMLNVLSCHSNKEIIEIVKILYPHSDGFMGHVNIGICAWVKNIKAESFPDLKHKIKVPPKLTVEALGLESNK